MMLYFKQLRLTGAFLSTSTSSSTPHHTTPVLATPVAACSLGYLTSIKQATSLARFHFAEAGHTKKKRYFWREQPHQHRYDTEQFNGRRGSTTQLLHWVSPPLPLPLPCEGRITHTRGFHGWAATYGIRGMARTGHYHMSDLRAHSSFTHPAQTHSHNRSR